jgi:hypothetical protein
VRVKHVQGERRSSGDRPQWRRVIGAAFRLVASIGASTPALSPEQVRLNHVRIYNRISEIPYLQTI